MPEKNSINIFWFRRDLRLHDNIALNHAVKSGRPVLALFIFDTIILNKLDSKDDARVSFIYDSLFKINEELKKHGSSVLVKHGKPLTVWNDITNEYTVNEIFFNHDYEPYAINRDQEFQKLAHKRNIKINTYKDHVIFEKDEIVKQDGTPYTVFTPYMNKWFERYSSGNLPGRFLTANLNNFYKCNYNFPDIKSIGFRKSNLEISQFMLDENIIKQYSKRRDNPSAGGTSKAGVHLRFGTISIRKLAQKSLSLSRQFVTELAWRDFFIQILFHFPHVATQSFKKNYDFIQWRNDEKEFEKWCTGKTGYPLVDAGMRELNSTGFMHNRVRMVTASFLCKHLLIDWRWGESYFASRLLDYELASNNGNWQWAAGCGCDAAPYFRIFNPHIQLKKFDSQLEYVRKWVPEYGTLEYSKEIVEHTFARERALKIYSEGLARK